MTERLSQKELESYLWGAATLLRGLIDASDYKQYIFPLLFFKRISDVWDEEHARMLEQYGEDFTDEHRFTTGCSGKAGHGSIYSVDCAGKLAGGFI